MPLTIAERKHLLPHGAQRRVARKVGATEGFVSGVVNETVEPRTPETKAKARRVRVLIARELRMKVDDVFPPPAAPAPQPEAVAV